MKAAKVRVVFGLGMGEHQWTLEQARCVRERLKRLIRAAEHEITEQCGDKQESFGAVCVRFAMHEGWHDNEAGLKWKHPKRRARSTSGGGA